MVLIRSEVEYYCQVSRLITAHLLESFMHRTVHTCSAGDAAERGQKMLTAILVTPPGKTDTSISGKVNVV